MEILISRWFQVLICTARRYGSGPHTIYISYTFSALNFPIKLVLGQNHIYYTLPRAEGGRVIFIYLKNFWEVIYNRSEIVSYSCMACSGHYFESFYTVSFFVYFILP